MATKCVRLKIIKPIDMDWKMFGDILYVCQKETRTLMNKAIQLCWEWDNFSSDYKNQNDNYPMAQEHLKYKSIAGYIYDKIGKNTKLGSANISQALSLTCQKWKNDKKDVFVGEKSIANFKKSNPIYLRNDSIKIYKNEKNEYLFNLSMLSNGYKKELNLPSSQIIILVDKGKNYSKTILERCSNGEYQIAGSQLIKKDKDWFINLSYNFEQKEVELSKDKILGVDMGIVHPIYMAIGGSYERASIDGGEIIKYRTTVEWRKNNILRQTKYCGEGRIGHGITTRIKPINKLSDRISNFRDTVNHKYSRFVVDFAIKNSCGTIQIEDLSGITVNKSKFLKYWSYFDLQNKIKYKAKEYGIEVVAVNPKYTSQRCSSCGCIDKENRQSQKQFICLVCGFKANADYNASLNIAIKDIDHIIKMYLEN